jgi:hypothetical protein
VWSVALGVRDTKVIYVESNGGGGDEDKRSGKQFECAIFANIRF